MVQIKLREVAVADLKPNPRNARIHSKKQIRRLGAIIEECGFCNPILTDERRRLIAGHARLAAAKQLGLETVPTIRISGLTRAQKRALALADNRLAEDATWDLELLGQALGELIEIDPEFDLELTGFETVEIDALLDGDPAGEEDAGDKLPDEDPARPVLSRPGDIWVLGENRLLCGDATFFPSFRALMGDDKARLVITDPPYNVPIDGYVCGKGRTKHREFPMASGEMSEIEYTDFLMTAFDHMGSFSALGSIHFVFMDWRHLPPALRAGRATYGDLKNLIVWVKSNAGLGAFYRSQHELILVFKHGGRKHINNFGLGERGRYRTNVWTYPGVNAFGKNRLEELRLHPTVKPVALVAEAIKDCSKRGDIVLDCFAGSGTILVAAEKTGRRARAMEIDPAYVDTAIRRWQEFTGKEAVHATTGQTFAEVESARSAPASKSTRRSASRKRR